MDFDPTKQYSKNENEEDNNDDNDKIESNPNIKEHVQITYNNESDDESEDDDERRKIIVILNRYYTSSRFGQTIKDMKFKEYNNLEKLSKKKLENLLNKIKLNLSNKGSNDILNTVLIASIGTVEN